MVPVTYPRVSGRENCQPATRTRPTRPENPTGSPVPVSFPMPSLPVFLTGHWAEKVQPGPTFQKTVFFGEQGQFSAVSPNVEFIQMIQAIPVHSSAKKIVKRLMATDGGAGGDFQFQWTHVNEFFFPVFNRSANKEIRRFIVKARDAFVARMQPYLDRHLPLISPRMEFTIYSAGPLPCITPRLDYANIQRIVDLRNRQSIHICPGPDKPVRGEHAEDQSGVGKLPQKDTGSELTSLPHKYKAPPGQPGRPNSGGYSLEYTLLQQYRWTKEKLNCVQDHVQRLARNQLVTKLSYQMQDPGDVKKLCKEITAQHDLAGYEDYWPIRAMLKLYLKSKSEVYRRKHMLNKPRPQHRVSRVEKSKMIHSQQQKSLETSSSEED
ncbi:hypothetical protein B0H11DRAFT_1914986 [Mycena galericulata]|nr:hypothetical protein B0H11DRAFT_1914986 [Mycena galericulata]